jgi:prephenate dehydratase
MLDEKTIKDRMTVLEEDIKKVNEQLVELEKNKVDALAMLNALSGAKQQCTHFLEQISDGGQASGQSDVSQEDEDEAAAVAFST